MGICSVLHLKSPSDYLWKCNDMHVWLPLSWLQQVTTLRTSLKPWPSCYYCWIWCKPVSLGHGDFNNDDRQTERSYLKAQLKPSWDRVIIGHISCFIRAMAFCHIRMTKPVNQWPHYNAKLMLYMPMSDDHYMILSIVQVMTIMNILLKTKLWAFAQSFNMKIPSDYS